MAALESRCQHQLVHVAGSNVLLHAPYARRMVFLGEREVVVPARDLTGRMLQDGLDALFGVCPWETLLTPTYRFFRLGPERPAEGEPAISRARPIAASKRPWWQFL